MAIFADDFNRANGSLGDNWSVLAGGIAIVDNAAQGDANEDSYAVVSDGQEWLDDARAEIELTAFGDAGRYQGVCCRLSAGPTCYVWFTNGQTATGQTALGRINGGAFTELRAWQSGDATPTAGHRYAIWAETLDGSTVRVHVEYSTDGGDSWNTWATFDDTAGSRITAAGGPGINTFDLGRIDNFYAEDSAGAGGGETLEATVTEGAEIGDTAAATVVVDEGQTIEATVTEGAEIGDTVSASITPAPPDVYQATVTEGLVIGHRLGPGKTIDFPAEGAEIGDTVSASVVQAVESIPVEVAEGAEIADAVSGEVVPLPPGTVTGQVSEGAEIGDTASAVLVPREPITVEGAVDEGAEIGDTASATLVPADAEVFPVLASEGIAIGDSWSAVVDSPEVFEVAVDEGAIISDVWTARVPRAVGPLTAAAVRHRPALTIAEVTRMPIYLDSDSTIEVIGLKDVNDETVTNATVTASLIRRGQTVPVWSGILPHIGGGDYRVDVPDDLEANEGEILIERIVISAGDTDATLQVDRRVRRRLS